MKANERVMDYEEYKRKALEPIVNYIESVFASYSKEELEDRIKKALPKKESEDEKIRKILISIVKDACGKGVKYEGNEIGEEKLLAYLEKHKEQKPAAEEVLIKAGLKPFKDGNQWCVLAGDNIQEGVCGFGDTIEDALYEFLKDVCKQNKPAEWSEEDEKMRDRILEILNKYGNIPVSGGKVQLRFNKEYMWLRHLYERFRPQPYWKPSGEQMKALGIALRCGIQLGTWEEDALRSLNDELKSL